MLKLSISNIQKQVESLRAEWNEVFTEKHTFDSDCPTCGQTLQEDKINAIKKEYQLKRAKKLEEITNKGKKTE